MFFSVRTCLWSLRWLSVHLFCCVLFALSPQLSYGNQTVFTVIASADLHGRVEQLRKAVAPALAKEFRKAPGRIIYADTGDCAQGSYELLQSRGRGFLSELNQLGCAFFVPGNHELEYGFEAFKNILKEFSGKVLAANLHAPEIAGSFSNFAIVEQDGVKIAFIGLMIKNMEYSFPVDEKRFRTLPGKAVLRKTVDQARRQGAEVMILLRHAGKYGAGENTCDLIKDIPEIALVIGAHTHRGDAGSMVGKAWYVQPPAYGKALVKVNITFDRKQRRIRQISSSFINLPQAAEPECMSTALMPVWKGRSLNHPAEVIREKCSADLVLYAVNDQNKLQMLLADPAPELKDFYEVFPSNDPMITVKVTAGEFKSILREYSRFAHKRKQYLARSGFALDLVRGRVRSAVLPAGKSLYTLAISAYAAAGAGGNLPDTRRILKDKIDRLQAEKSASVLDVLTAR